jgi:hypothetical protein
MNITNAFGKVSYRTVRVDDLDIFYREAGPKRWTCDSAPARAAVIFPDVSAAVGIGIG